jgi:hypothetical protein
MSSASSRSCRWRAQEHRSHLFRRPGQQDLKVVIARTSPVWRTVARCWRNGVVLVSEHYIESFRQEGQDAHQNNQGCRITHACRSTASDGYEKIRLTATSLGRRLASLLGKLPTPRAHETPPESGAFIMFCQDRCQRPSLRRHHAIPRRPRPNKPSVPGSGTPVVLTLVA